MTIERPMFPPVDPTRRRFLAVAAVASAIGIPISAAPEGINLPTNKDKDLGAKTAAKEITPSQSIEADPIFAAIEAHKRAYAAFDDRIGRHSKLENE